MVVKTCRVCLVAKDAGDFRTVRKNGREYLDSYCRECNRAISKLQYYKRGKEYQRQKSAEFRKRNPEKVREYRQRFKERHERYYRHYRHTMKGRAVHLWGNASRNARMKGIPFSLEVSWVLERLEAGVCEATGLPLCFERPNGTRRNPRAPSLDRIDPSKGYEPDNVQLVCWQYNLAKCEYGIEVLNEMVEALAQRLDNQQGSPARGTFNDHPERE